MDDPQGNHATHQSEGLTSVSHALAVGIVTVMVAVLPLFGDTFTSTAHAQTASPPEAIDTSKPWTRKAAFQASEGRIVLHYGEGILDIDAETEASSLSRSGYPAIAVSGGPTGQVELFVGEKIVGKFDQRQIDTGLLGMHAIKFYNTIVRKRPDLNNSPVAPKGPLLK